MSWSEKTIPKLFWRGSLTGAFHNYYTPWRQSQRERMIYLANSQEGYKDVLVETERGEIEMKEFGVKEMNDRWLDIAPTGGAVQVSRSPRGSVARTVTVLTTCCPPFAVVSVYLSLHSYVTSRT
jgi:hypothetical protein